MGRIPLTSATNTLPITKSPSFSHVPTHPSFWPPGGPSCVLQGSATLAGWLATFREIRWRPSSKMRAWRESFGIDPASGGRGNLDRLGLWRKKCANRNKSNEMSVVGRRMGRRLNNLSRGETSERIVDAFAGEPSLNRLAVPFHALEGLRSIDRSIDRPIKQPVDRCMDQSMPVSSAFGWNLEWNGSKAAWWPHMSLGRSTVLA